MTPLTTVAARRRSSTRRNRRCSSRGRSVERSVRSGGLTRAFAVALQGRPCTRRTPPPASTGRPGTCSRDDRRRNSRGRSLGQNPRHRRRGHSRALANRASLSRGRRTRGLACVLLLEHLQLSLRDGPVHTPVPTILVLLLEMLPAQIPASLLWRAPALPASSAPPRPSHALRGVNVIWREATPFVPRERRPRAWLDSSRRRVRGRNARGRASVVVLVARAARGWREQLALPAPARRRLRLPRSAGLPVASARLPATRPTPLGRWLAPRRLLPGGRTGRRRRRGRGAGGSAGAAASAPRRPRRAPACMPERRSRRSRRRTRRSRTSAAAGAPRRPRRRAPAASAPRTRPAHIREHIGANVHLAVSGDLRPSHGPDNRVVEFGVFVHAHGCKRIIVAARRAFALVHHDPREIVLALGIHRPQDLRKAHCPSVVPLAPILARDHPLHNHEEHWRRPLPAIACIYPDALTDPGRRPLSIIEVSVRRTSLPWLTDMP